MRDKVYLERLIKYIDRIKGYMMGIYTYEEFVANAQIVDAVLFNLQNIGETSRKISADFRDEYTQIPWISIIGLRNMISHEYEGIDYSIIFDIVMVDIPELHIILKAIID